MPTIKEYYPSDKSTHFSCIRVTFCLMVDLNIEETV